MTGAAAALRPDALARPAWERSVLDDVAAKRPWNLRVKWARQRALRRLDALAEGVTVVIVNWNTRDVTADVIRAVQRYSPQGVRILVVDNGSTDGSREMLAPGRESTPCSCGPTPVTGWRWTSRSAPLGPESW